MVGGAHGQAGHCVRQLVVAVKELDNACVTILLPQEVEAIVLVIIVSKEFVALQVVQVRPPLKN